jgi:catechol 2,3-dioxygenase-like lactoylglutathione lyase family enzyme
METAISDLVKSYERGSLSRRQLIAGLAMLAIQPAANAAASPGVFQGTTIDHVSIQVSDLKRSIGFYMDVFGLPFLKDDKNNEAYLKGDTKNDTVRLAVGGKSRIAIRRNKPAGIVDHFAFGCEHFDKAGVTATLKKRGVTVLDTPEPASFHVIDPDGYSVQIMDNSTRG